MRDYLVLSAYDIYDSILILTQFSWRVEEWSQCGPGCGGGKGTRSRSIVCVDQQSVAGGGTNAGVYHLLHDSYCSDRDRPTQTESCLRPACSAG